MKQVVEVSGRLWLRGGTSVLLSEGRLFRSSGLHVEVSLGKLLLMCWLASCMAASTISVWHPWLVWCEGLLQGRVEDLRLRLQPWTNKQTVQTPPTNNKLLTASLKLLTRYTSSHGAPCVVPHATHNLINNNWWIRDDYLLWCIIRSNSHWITLGHHPWIITHWSPAFLIMEAY